MSTRYGRRAADGTFEYHESKDSLNESARSESSAKLAFHFGWIGLLVGSSAAYISLSKLGVDWPKWLRFVLVIAAGGGLAYVMAKLADLILTIILTLLVLTVLCGIGMMLWRSL